jgi:photosystem II stability/assembly factor-like uncharacterized protein
MIGGRAVAAGLALLSVAPVWTVQQSGVTATLRGVSAASDRVVWASGSRGTVLRSADGGTTWTKLTVTPEPLDFRDVDAISDRIAYALSIGTGPLSRIYKTSDAGATWTLQFTSGDPQAFLDAMALWDERTGIVVGDSVDGQFYILLTRDAGTTWTRVPPTALPPALPNEGAFAASGTNVAVLEQHAWFGTGAAARARVLHTSDRGATRTIAETPLGAGQTAGIYSIAFRDALHGVIVGGDYRQESQAVKNLAVTADGGKTWTVGTGLGGFRSVVSSVPGAATSWVAVGPLGSDLSVDDGRTWAPIEGAGYHTFSFAPGKPVGWGAGGQGRVGMLKLP